MVVSRRPFGLAIAWIIGAALLTGWGLLVRPGALTPGPEPGQMLTVLAEAPPHAMLSLSVRLDAPPGTTAWIVLGSGERWGTSAELYWRRQIHPGWNHLTWDDLLGLAGRGPLTLRLEAAAPLRFMVGEPRVSFRYGLVHLSPIRGLLAAAALVLVLSAAAGARWLCRRVFENTIVGGTISRKSSVPRARAWVLALLCVGALSLALRLHTLGAQSFWFDEVLTAIGAQSFAWVLYAPQIFGHPPLQYLITWSMSGEGLGEAWLRAPFVAAGTGSVMALGFLGRRLLGPTSGLVAAALLGLAPFHVELSQLARPYAFLLLFSVGSLLALVRALEAPGTARWLWFSALATLNLYAHYLAAEMLIVHAIVAAGWLGRRRGVGWPGVVLGFAGIGVLYLPWFPVVMRMAGGHAGSGHLPLASLLDLAWRVFVPQFLGAGAAGPAALALAAIGLLALHRRPAIAIALAAWVLVPFLAIWLAQPRHFVAGRHVAFVMPALMLLVAHGLAALVGAALRGVPRTVRVPRRVVARSAVAAPAALLLWSAAIPEALGWYYHRRHGTDWRTVADVLERLVAPGDFVRATLGAEYPLRYYWRPEVEGFDPASVPARSPVRPEGERVWVVTLARWDDSPRLVEWLSAHAILVGEVPPSWSLPTVYIHRAR
jgi:hypothetical protein